MRGLAKKVDVGLVRGQAKEAIIKTLLEEAGQTQKCKSGNGAEQSSGSGANLLHMGLDRRHGHRGSPHRGAPGRAVGRRWTIFDLENLVDIPTGGSGGQEAQVPMG